jgi:hypothetical protein
MDHLLTDLISYNGDQSVLFHWENFSTPVSNSLQRMLHRYGVKDSWREGICFKHLEGIKVSDLMDTPHVGVLRKTQVLNELNSVFRSHEINGDAFIVAPEIDFEDLIFPDTIDTATNLELLITGIIEIFNEYRAIDERTMTVLHGRVPAFLRTLRTLDDIALEYSVTRERIRQIENKYKDLQIDPFKLENHLLSGFVDTLEQSQNEGEFVSTLKNSGLLGNETISISKLKAVLWILGLEQFITRVEAVEAIWDAQLDAINELIVLAQKHRSKFGLIDLDVFTVETKTTETEAFESIKIAYPRSILKGKLVLARTLRLDTAFENAIGKQLKVFGSLDPAVLLVGIERQASFRQTVLVGSKEDQIALITEIAGGETTYEEYRENTVEEPELSPTDIWFLEVFQLSPNGMMHRNELTSAALRDGKNLNSISVFLLFNPLIRPVGSAVMALANVTPDPDYVSRYARIANASEEKTFLDFEFSGANILLKIRPNLNTMAAGVLFPSSDLRAMVLDSVFPVTCSCGRMESVQRLRLRPPNFWTGFTAAIKHAITQHNYVKGEEIKILLDFEKKSAILMSDV